MQSLSITRLLVVLVLLGLGLGVVLASSAVEADAGDYDANGNGRIEHDEALAVIIDYFEGEVTRDDVLLLAAMRTSGRPLRLSRTPCPVP